MDAIYVNRTCYFVDVCPIFIYMYIMYNYPQHTPGTYDSYTKESHTELGWFDEYEYDCNDKLSAESL